MPYTPATRLLVTFSTSITFGSTGDERSCVAVTPLSSSRALLPVAR